MSRITRHVKNNPQKFLRSGYSVNDYTTVQRLDGATVIITQNFLKSVNLIGG